MKYKTWLLINRTAALLLALLVVNFALSGCAYKKCTHKTNPNVVRTYTQPTNYVIIYSGDKHYRLKYPELKHDTLCGELTPVDDVYLPYLLNDTVNLKYSGLKERYRPAEGIHITTNLALDLSKPSVKIPLGSILLIQAYHWKMKTAPKFILGASVVVVVVGGLVLLLVMAMQDFSVYP